MSSIIRNTAPPPPGPEQAPPAGADEPAAGGSAPRPALRARVTHAAAGAPSAPASQRHGRLIHADGVGLQLPISLAAHAGGRDGGGGESPAELAELREAARQQGYQEGHAAGLAAAEAEMAAAVEHLAHLAATVATEHERFYRSAERQVIDLALQIAQKVVEREIENVPDLAVGIIRSALEEMDGRTVVRVRVSQEDAELLSRRWAVAIPPTIGSNRVEMVVDPHVQSGGAVIETTHGQADAQLETKLQQLGNALWTLAADLATEVERAEAA